MDGFPVNPQNRFYSIKQITLHSFKAGGNRVNSAIIL